MKLLNTIPKLDNDRTDAPAIRVRVVAYDYDFESRPDDRLEYGQMHKMLKARGDKLFDCTASDHYLPPDGRWLLLSTKQLFTPGQQWHSTDVESGEKNRAHNWYEAISLQYQNSRKRGYYLSTVKDMKPFTHERFCCGYCGAQYLEPDGEFCQECLGGEYLEEDNLGLLQLQRMDKDGDRRTVVVPPALLEAFYKAKTYSAVALTHSRNPEKLEDNYKIQLEEAAEKKRQAEEEYAGYKWLFANGISTNNIIYYKASGFCVGWRQELSAGIAEAFKGALVGFPYDIELRKEKG